MNRVPIQQGSLRFRFTLFWALTVAALAPLGACSRPQAGEARNAPNETAASVNRPVASPSAMSIIFRPDVIGSTIRHLEVTTGPPVTELGDDLTYKVNGCTVVVGRINGTVGNIGIEGWSSSCSFDVDSFFGKRDKSLPSAGMLTFGDIDDHFGAITEATCLDDCGTTGAWLITTYNGSDADAGNMLVASAKIVEGSRAQSAAEAWAAELRKAHDDDYVKLGSYLCGSDPSDVLDRESRTVRPDSVRVGADINLADVSCRQ